MTRYLVKRVLNMAPIIAGVSVIVFMLLHLSSGDPAYIKLSGMGIPVTQELLEQTRADLGLDRPAYQQFWAWFTGMLSGDFGTSYLSGRPVGQELAEKMFYTLQLSLAAFILTIVISVPLGVIAALYANTAVDYLIRITSFWATAMPVFLMGLILIYFFSLRFHIFPVSGSGGLNSLILPTVSLSLGLVGRFTKQIRIAILEEINQDYVSAARIRGLPERIVLVKHVLRGSLISVVTVLGISFGLLLGGTAVIEIMFVWPGVGKLVVEAVRHRDYPVIQGFTVWMAVIYCLINLGVDLLCAALDPRIRSGVR